MSTEEDDLRSHVQQNLQGTFGDVAGRDITKTTVGNITNSHGVAIGPNARAEVHRIITQGLPPVAPADQEAIHQELAQVKAQLTALQAQLSEAQQQMAQLQLEALEHELTQEESYPDTTVIEQTVNWLLKNAPVLTETVRRMFENPAIQTALRRAGEAVVLWINLKFGLNISL